MERMTPEEIIDTARRRFDQYAADEPPFANADTELSLIQCQLAAWQTRNFGLQTIECNVLGVAEECGELSHAVLKHVQKIRGMESTEALRLAGGDAVADIVIYLMQTCTTMRLDFETLVRLTAGRVMFRDWIKDKMGGGEQPAAPVEDVIIEDVVIDHVSIDLGAHEPPSNPDDYLICCVCGALPNNTGAPTLPCPRSTVPIRHGGGCKGTLVWKSHLDRLKAEAANV